MCHADALFHIVKDLDVVMFIRSFKRWISLKRIKASVTMSSRSVSASSGADRPNSRPTFKTPRPVPVISSDQSFSHKKKGITRYSPPKPPAKSAPPISRVFRYTRKSTSGPQAVSFRERNSSILFTDWAKDHWPKQRPMFYSIWFVCTKNAYTLIEECPHISVRKCISYYKLVWHVQSIIVLTFSNFPI